MWMKEGSREYITKPQPIETFLSPSRLNYQISKQPVYVEEMKKCSNRKKKLKIRLNTREYARRAEHSNDKLENAEDMYDVTSKIL